MIFLLCPQCENAMLEVTATGRCCPECDHTMTEIEYQVYHAKRAAQVDRAMDSVPRAARRTFGKKKPDASDSLS